MHVLPSAPYAAALGETRLVNTDQTIRFGSVRYSTPPGLVGAEVWVRVAGDELVIVADLDALALRPGWRRRHRPGWSRSPATRCPRRAGRGSSCRTTPATPRTRPGRRAHPHQAHQPGGDRVPRPGSRRGSVADRGRRRRGGAGAGEDGRRGRARRSGRPSRGRCRARGRRRRRSVRRGRPARHRAPPRRRRPIGGVGGRRRDTLRPSAAPSPGKGSADDPAIAPHPGPPPPPFVLIDTTFVDQAAAALARLESGWPAATRPPEQTYAHACSNGEEDPDAVAGWVGTLSDLLRNQIEEADSWS